MDQILRKGCLLFAGALVMASGPAFGRDKDVSPAGADEKVARLEALLEAQQQQISNLQRQVSDASTQDADAQRVEAMRDQLRQLLGESEFREQLTSATLQTGYDNGFYIRSADDKFFLRINGRMQFRFTHYGTRATNRYLRPGYQRNDRTGFDVQRLRLTFSGHAYDPNLTYHITLRSEARNAYDTQTHYAWINYRFQDEFQFMAGIFRLASTRAQMTSDANLSFVDRPVPDAVFGLGIGLGVRFWGQLFDKRLDYYLDVVNSLNAAANRTITTDPAEMDNNPAVLFRAVWHAMGDDPGNEFRSQADHANHASPAIDIGFHYAFNEDEGDTRTTRIPFPLPYRFGRGGFGLTSTNGLQIHQFGLDAAIKCNGFSLIGEYWVRSVDPRRAGRRPFTPWWLLTGQGDTTAQHGAYVQMGYFLPIPGLENKLEAVARVGGISALANGQEGTWSYGAGLNYYLEGDKVKLQTDFTKVTEVPISAIDQSLANVNDDALIWRVQLQVGF